MTVKRYTDAEEKRLENNRASRAARRRLVAKALRMYGGKCECCEMDNPLYLTLDHRNGDGKEHRAQGGQRNTIRDAIATYAPERFQVLCVACNWSKHDNKSCQIDHTIDPWSFLEDTLRPKGK